MIEIRKAEIGDLERVEYICRMTADEESIKDENAGRIISLMYSTYYIEEETDNCFVLVDNGEVVGYIISSVNPLKLNKRYKEKYIKQIQEIDNKSAFMARFIPLPYLLLRFKYPAHLHINLLPDYQGKGFGTKMINTLLSELKEKGIKSVMLLADSKNTGAIKFYKRNGFKKFITAFGGVGMYKKLR